MQEIGQWLDDAVSTPTDVRTGCINIYVVALIKVGLWEAAIDRYHNMLSPTSPVHPTAATFNAVMGGFCRQGNLQAVNGVFEDMQHAGVSPTIVTYNTILSAQAGGVAWSEALETLQRALDARMEGINPNTQTCEFFFEKGIVFCR